MILGYVKNKQENSVFPFVEKDENGYLILDDFGGKKWSDGRWWEEVEEPKENHILENVKMIMDKQTEKGLKKYGETVNPDSYNLEEWIVHLQEELVDALVYTETIKEKVRQFKKIVG